MLYRYLKRVLGAFLAVALVFIGAIGGCLGTAAIGERLSSDSAVGVIVAISGGIVGLLIGILAAKKVYARLSKQENEP